MTVNEQATTAQDDTKAADAATTTTTTETPKETVLAGADATAQKVETKETADKPIVPEKYELKLPDGSLLDAKHLEELSSYAKEKKLSNEQAQALVEREHKAVASFVQKQQEELSQKPQAWLAEAKADKEVGGEAFGKNAELAKRVFAKYASDPLKAMMNETGLGNHPELFRMFVRLGKAMSEDSLVVPGQHAGGERKLSDIFYSKQQEDAAS